MKIGYDPAKNVANIANHGLSFDDVPALDWSVAFSRPDSRRDYGETRIQTAVRGRDGKPYVVVHTSRGDLMWVISFRRAHEEEWKNYAQKA